MVTDTSGDEDLLAPGVVPTAAAEDFGADRGTEEIPEPESGVDEAEAADVAEPEFANVYVFVEELLAPMYARGNVGTSSGDFRWCARWFEHVEAISRLDALWQAFEALRHEEGTGPASWWRDFADPTMAVLSSSDGPFRRCGPDKHDVPAPLPTADPGAVLRAEHTSSESSIRHTRGDSDE